MCFKVLHLFLEFFFFFSSNIYVHTFFVIGSYGEVYHADMNGTVSSLIPFRTCWEYYCYKLNWKIFILSYSE